jgi:hypothetical protein
MHTPTDDQAERDAEFDRLAALADGGPMPTPAIPITDRKDGASVSLAAIAEDNPIGRWIATGEKPPPGLGEPSSLDDMSKDPLLKNIKNGDQLWGGIKEMLDRFRATGKCLP